MLLIVAHHYVINSGLLSNDGPILKNPYSWRSIFLLIFGAFGKTGINCFVLITGYYMCKSNITARKYFKLLSEIIFYNCIIAIIFLLTGYSSLTFKMIIKIFFPFSIITTNFVGCFLLFYLMIPYLTILINNMTKSQHASLLCICLFFCTFLKSIPIFCVSINYIGWFIVLFLIASFIRLYFEDYMERSNTKYEIGGGIFIVIIDIFSILFMIFISKYYCLKFKPYFMVGESPLILPLLTAIIFFVIFKKMKLSYIPIINIMGSSTFGVLLIHGNSDAMRNFLWKDLLRNSEIYYSRFIVIHAIVSVLCIFIFCVIIDRLRIFFIEPYLMSIFDKYLGKYI